MHHFHQIALGVDHGIDILISHRDLIDHVLILTVLYTGFVNSLVVSRLMN